ncbi:MAG: hypothetical protein NTY38_11505 [Acidobacteria bacterium]|nr:hypothetical protein [Acidobacteriota bacterium]
MRCTTMLTLGFLWAASLSHGQSVAGVTVAGVHNAAAVSQSTGVTPGSLVTILGSSLSGALASADSVAISTMLGDVASVTINGIAAPLISVAPGQIVAQTPWEVRAGPATVVVNRTDSSSTPVTVDVKQFAPAIFTVGFGGPQALAVNADGAVAAAAGSVGGLTAHPATVGDTLTLWATGLGAVNTPLANGTLPADDSAVATTTPVVTIGGVSTQVNLAALSRRSLGVYQLVIVVPPGVPTGSAVPVVIQMNDVTSPDAVTIALQ